MYQDKLTQEARIDLKEKLLLIAEWYFTAEIRVDTECGICFALNKAFDSDYRIKYYKQMSLLLSEFQGEDDLGDYTDTYKKWENRAYMCLLLAEYLDNTIDLKSTEILSKARVFLVDGSYAYCTDDWSNYICDCIRVIERDMGSTQKTVDKCRNLRGDISQRLEAMFSLDDWLVRKGYCTYKEIRANPVKMQKTRYNMIDDMILYYESKGD